MLEVLCVCRSLVHEIMRERARVRVRERERKRGRKRKRENFPEELSFFKFQATLCLTWKFSIGWS